MMQERRGRRSRSLARSGLSGGVCVGSGGVYLGDLPVPV